MWGTLQGTVYIDFDEWKGVSINFKKDINN